MTQSLPPVLAQLAALCEAHPPHHGKILFVPRIQVGRALQSALAASGVSWLNLRATTPLRHAGTAAAPTLRRLGLRPLPSGAGILIADAVLRSGAVPYFGADPAAGVARALFKTVSTLRMAGAEPQALERAAASERAAAMAAFYRAYVGIMGRHGLADEALVFRAALDAAAAGEASVLAVMDEVALREPAFRYLSRIAEGKECYRIAHTGAAPPPLQSAGARLAGNEHWKRLIPNELPEGPATLHLAEAVGVENEVRAVLRHILERELPLDAVEVAYVANDPYLALFCSAARRFDLPVTLAAGVPVRLTRTGQALCGFLTWIEEGLEAKTLVRLLRGDLLRIEGDDRLPAHEVASLLAESGAARGRAAYDSALAELAQGRSEAVQEKIGEARAIIRRLLSLVPPDPEATAARMAASTLAFLRLFGPAQIAAEKRPESYTPDEHAAVMLMRRLAAYGDGIPMSGPPRALARRLREALEAMFVGARAPRPGHLHVVPLSSAGYSGRPHLFVVGMDEASFALSNAEDPLLLDEERSALNLTGAAALPLERERPSGGAFHLERALTSARAVTLVANRLDLENDRERARSAAFIDALERADHDAVVLHGFAPAAQGSERLWSLGDITLDDAEYWLAARHDASSEADELRRRHYPLPHAGRQAAEARASDKLTPHDGLLRATPGLEGVLERTASASRLETLVTCPYKFFLRYVLGVSAPRDRERDEDRCLESNEEGDLLHELFRAYLSDVVARGARPQEEDRGRLHELLEAHLALRHERALAATPEGADAVRRRLHSAADVFLSAEVAYAAEGEPAHFELGFGLAPGEARGPGDREGEFALELAQDLRIPLKGWVDRVDVLPDGTLAVWDYKTGSPSRFLEDDLLKGGKNLQWALYSLAVEQLLGRKVSRSGYFLTSRRGAGQRIDDTPGRVREEMARILREALSDARAGRFMPRPSADACRYCDYARVCGPAAARRAEVEAKQEAPLGTAEI